MSDNLHHALPFILPLSMALSVAAVAGAFGIYDWRRELADAGTPALRCDVEVGYGEDHFDVYAVRPRSRTLVARGVAGAGPAVSAAALLCPIPTPTRGHGREEQ